jgi:uncharacterized protein (TIGR03083 family)
MPTIVDQQSTVDLLRHEFAAIRSLCAVLTAEQWATPTCLPGWTVHDVLGHVIGTEAMLTGEETPSADISHLDHMANAIAESNEVWVESVRSLSGEEMLARFDQVIGARLKALNAMDPADFDAPSWTPAGRDETYGRFMRIRHYDCFMHEHDIRGALGRPSRTDPADLASALDEVGTGLGYIVGRRAAMPEGSRIRLDLVGPLPRTFRVAVVDGRASVVGSLDGEPTVVVEMPATLFLRLTGGRDDGIPPADAGLAVSGDLDLGTRLVDNLAFTI